jgi:hypothetical protein
MNAGQKRASLSAILIFADLRQVANGSAEALHNSILVDDVQQGRRFLLSSHESTSDARPIARSALRALTWNGLGGQEGKSAACSPRLLASRRRSFGRSPISHPSFLCARRSASAGVSRCALARPGTIDANDAAKTSCKDSNRLLAASHGGRFGGGILRRTYR